MQVKILAELFDPWQEVQAYQQAAAEMAGKFGATKLTDIPTKRYAELLAAAEEI